MGRFQVKKQDTFIDMTPMSDVMILLLTFFMLTATFTKEEPILVNVPGSVSEIKIPEANIMTIYVNTQGKVFMVMDSPDRMKMMAQEMIDHKKLDLTAQEVEAFAQVPTFGTPLNVMKSWVNMDPQKRNKILQEDASAGIPCHGEGEEREGDELKEWVLAARNTCGQDMRIAIKADKTAPYSTIKEVMNSLRAIDESRYNLITTLKGGE